MIRRAVLLLLVAACGATPARSPRGGVEPLPVSEEQALFMRMGGASWTSAEIRAHHARLVDRVARDDARARSEGVPAEARARGAHAARLRAWEACRAMVNDPVALAALRPRPSYEERVVLERKAGRDGDALHDAIARGSPEDARLDDLPDAAPEAPLADLERIFAPALAPDGPGGPGGAVLVTKDRRVVFSGAYGLADLGTREPITTRTLFNLGSVSKTFVASALLILAERGKLTIDDPLLRYFPGFARPELVRGVTLRHLLAHASGLPDNRRVAEKPAFYLTAKDEENWAPELEVDALDFAPGTRFRYSNPAFNGLALVIEKVSGTRWQSFVADNVLRPAGMTTSTITDGAHPRSGVAHGYVKENGAWHEQDYGEEPTFPAAGNGGVWSSVEELARYEAALEDGTFLSRPAVAAARTPQRFAGWSDAVPPFVGLSWFVGRAPGERVSVGHVGIQGGFRASYLSIPSQHVLVVAICNSPVELEAVTGRAVRWLAAHDAPGRR